MRSVKPVGRVRGIAALAGTVVVALGLAGCGPSARDMPVVAIPDAGGGVRLLFPVCSGDHVQSVTVNGTDQHAKWKVGEQSGDGSAPNRVLELKFAADGFSGGQQLAGSRLLSDPGEGPISSSFFDLHSVDIWTGEGEAYIQIAWFADPDATQLLLAKVPYKDGDVSVQTVSEADGRSRLLAWCE